MDLTKLFFLAIFLGLIFLGAVMWDRINRTNRGLAFLREQGVNLDYYYKNFLGVSQAKRKLFVNVSQPLLLDADRVRGVEKNSIFQTKSNGLGMVFHKDKNCNLTIHTDDLGAPIHTITFDEVKEMDLWYARLGVFCNLN